MQNVAVIVQDDVEPFGLGALCELWAEPYHAEDDNPVFDFVVCAPRPGRVRGVSGFDLQVPNSLDAAADADLICVAPNRAITEDDPQVLELLRTADEDGRHVFSHCSAVFTLGRAGLLDGRRCTTHWRYAERLAQMFPAATVDPDVLYVSDGNLTTGAGAAAVLDAGLHLMRKVFGAGVAAPAARRMVVLPHRDGGQSQYIARAVPDCEARTLGPLLVWITENLRADLSVDALARRAHMSPRTFARRFRAETGQTPHAWVIAQRVAAAEEMLETGEGSVEWIADQVGFGNAGTLRQHFLRERGVSPQTYRRTFGTAPTPIPAAPTAPAGG